jgi:CHAT domain
MHYDELSIEVGPHREGGDGGYPVTVLGSPAGRARGISHALIGVESLGALLDRLERDLRAAAGRGAADNRRDLAPASTSGLADASAREIGDLLFRTLFPDPLRSLLDRSLGPVEEDPERGLRIRLHLDLAHPDSCLLASLPWELLYRRERREFLGLGRSTPLVRSIDVPRPERTLRVAGPLRVLLALAGPDGSPMLQLDDERQRILGSWLFREGVSVTALEHATPASLRAKLQEGPFHVLHFMGHGGFDPASGEGALLFEDDLGRGAPLTGPVVADLVRDFAALRLVVLNACESARSSRRSGLDPFAGVAAGLLMAGLPAVLAMQLPISDDGAIAFSEAFYRRLAAGDPVDAATVEGRMALHLRHPLSLEWATPALFLRALDCRLFEAGDSGAMPAGIRGHLLDFSSFIAEKTAGFVGRRWIFDAFDQFTSDVPRGYFVVRGDPGIGKSALVAQMSKRPGHVHHFSIRAAGLVEPESFLGNICSQLIEAFGLGDTSLPPEACRDSRFLSVLLDRVAARLRPGERAVLLVDALDETDSFALPPGANTLLLPFTLPAGVYILATTRRGPLHLRCECPLRILDLAQDMEPNVGDVRELVRDRLTTAGIRNYLDLHRMEDEEFVGQLVAKSQGNFMYLRHVLPEIESGAYRDLRLDCLPIGLESYYEDHWRRMRHQDEEVWLAYQIPVLVALTVLREAVSVDLITAFSGVADRRRIRAVLGAWEAFLWSAEVEHGGQRQRRYRLYHASFQEFIAAKDEIAGEQVDLKAAHQKIAEVLWQDLQSS